MKLSSPNQEQNNQAQLLDPFYQQKLQESFAYYSDKWDSENLSYHYKIKRQWLLNTIRAFEQTKNHHNCNVQILDAGCGNGMYLIDIVEALENIDGMGVDLTVEMVEVSRKKSSHLKNKYEWMQMDLENDDYQLKMGANQFDIIMLNGAICYFKHITKVLQSLKNLLKKDGNLIIIQHDPNNLTNIVLKIQSLLDSKFIWVENTAKPDIINYAKTAGYILKNSQTLPCGGMPDVLYTIGKIFWDGYGLVFTLK